ncbi:hypothetical protein FSP39_009890 [Pinctada imbricata]|uniref:Uncharacterized protein n=1 Tax=Pinctada imbricata TaxID=66713 RepID=A0AA89BLU0_PINIB|nr:hypothetical protein FSP39_009890 [Pinctada imbricata]
MSGIRGLSHVIQQNSHLLQDCKLHDGKIVIVGNILQNLILDRGEETRECGGDYLEYTKTLFDLFTMLQQCHVTPYVIMYSENDQDEEIQQKKQVKKMEEQQQSLQEGQRHKIRPLLTHEAFLHVIHSLNLPFFVQHAKDLREVVILANDLDCPVLCQVSDFYAFLLKAGFIPFKTLMWHLQVGQQADGVSSYKYLNCKIYFADNLTKCFPGLKNDSLVAIATLFGNRYLTKREIWKFYAKLLEMPIQNNLNLNFHPKYPEAMKVMNWIAQQESLQSIMEEVLECLTENKDMVRESISKALDWFGLESNKHTQPLIEYFQGIQKYHQVKTSPGVPEWLTLMYQRGEISVVIPRLISIPRNIFFSQVEDVVSPSSFECATSLRQVVYGILNSTCTQGGQIEEIYRGKRSVKSVHVDPAKGTPSLLDIPLLDMYLRKLIILDALKETNGNVDLPADAEFFTAIIKYCLENSNPKLNEHHVRALICCFLVMNVKFESLLSRAKDRSAIQETVYMMSKHTIAGLEEKWGSLCQHNRQEYDIRVIHAFAQFQACFLAALDLNQLLLCPFPNLNPARVIHGTFLHNVFVKLAANTIPKSVIEDLFDGNQCFLEMFSKMESAVLDPLFL